MRCCICGFLGAEIHYRLPTWGPGFGAAMPTANERAAWRTHFGPLMPEYSEVACHQECEPQVKARITAFEKEVSK